MQNRSKFSFAGLLCSLVAAVALPSCHVATPQSRIDSNPLLYTSLTAEQQALVSQGRICEGMSPDAVFLAWGAPDSTPFEGQKNGKHVVRWVYNTQEPVFVDNYDRPFGWCDPRYDCWAHGYAGTGVAYVPCNVATVVFENGKVVSWERRSAR